MSTIYAKMNSRLLAKVDRLFPGTLEGRITEILQNARRGGARTVKITNDNGFVTVCDDGRGIEDFSKLLDLGASGWDDAIEKAEDPAGVGIFCLAPREVTIASRGSRVVITSKAWTGTPVEVIADSVASKGTTLRFEDDKWDFDIVEKQSVFSGMSVTVDGKQCAQAHFVSKKAVVHPELGCTIEICDSDSLSQWHSSIIHDYYYNNVLVNFHGQVISFPYKPNSKHCLVYCVDMSGQPTGIRLMLPARTRIVENDALEELKAAIEIEAYRYIARQDHHILPYSEYLRGRELGIDLEESAPVFRAGTLVGDMPEPVEIAVPDDFLIHRCYRPNAVSLEDDDAAFANIHLLAALGDFKKPFVPVTIDKEYDGYRWSKLPTIDRVEVTIGKKLGQSSLGWETLAAAAAIRIVAYASDGNIFGSDVPMAVVPSSKKESRWSATTVYVTPQAQKRLEASDIWHQLGGYSDEGDTYDTQLFEFERELEMFWTRIIGPGESLRSRIFESVSSAGIKWKRIIVDDDGTVTIETKNGKQKVLKP